MQKPEFGAILKWPGGKGRLLPAIKSHLPEGKVLVEPFVGSGIVFLNTDYDQYLLSDCNADLIQLFQCVQQQGEEFIAYAKQFYTKRNNAKSRYYHLRDQFNDCSDPQERAALFLYLNRHGYNGLCRYNSSGGYNVPFGQYEQVNFPEQAMRYFHEKSQRATFYCDDFAAVMKKAKKDHVIYCDPPYAPLVQDSNFVNYAGNDFDISEQERLATLSHKLAKKGIPVLLSNHATPLTKKLYQGAKKISHYKVNRHISCKPEGRVAVSELLALIDYR